MVDNFNDLTYVLLMISTSQEENLSGKKSFEIWDVTFGVKISIHHAAQIRYRGNNYNLCPYALKDFVEKWNKLNVYDDGITPMENFSDTKTDIIIKKTIYESIQFMSWMEGYKAKYMSLPSGKLVRVQGFTFVIQNFMQGQ